MANAFTSRVELEQILLELTCRTKNTRKSPPFDLDPACGAEAPALIPAAIGIDLDFSPVDGRFVYPGDPEFFSTCLALSRDSEVPILLGVYRTLKLPVDQWLGFPEFRPLAAAIPMPENPKKALRTDVNQAPILASALAEAYTKHKGNDTSGEKSSADKSGFFTVFESEEETQKLSILINYRANKNIKFVDHESVESGNFERGLVAGKIVLIGDRNPEIEDRAPSDRFEVPIDSDRVGGVLVQAAAAYTMVTPEAHLRSLRPCLDLSADLVLGVIVNCVIFCGRRLKVIGRSERAGQMIFAVAILLVLGIGVIANRYFLWDGCLIVASALAAEPFLDRFAEHLESKKGRNASQAH